MRRVFHRFAVIAAIVPMAGICSVPDTRLPAPSAAVSSDGFIRVVAYEDLRDGTGYRMPILGFAGKTIDAVCEEFGMKRERSNEPRLVIFALDGRTNDTRVIVKHSVRKDGSPLTKIYLPSPGYSDLAELKEQIVRTFTGMELPAWIAQGVARCLDGKTRREDQRRALEIWLDGRMPYFPTICARMRRTEGRGAFLSGYMASWIKERKILGRLSAEGWDPAKFAEWLTGEKEPCLQDRSADEHLAKLARSVLEPGDCGKVELDIFSSRLFLRAPLFDANIIGSRRECTFADALDAGGSNLAVMAAAFLKAREIPLYAIGKGDELMSIASGYERFLLGVAAGEDQSDLGRLLAAADLKLKDAYEKREKDDNRKR